MENTIIKKHVSLLLQLDWTLLKWMNKKCCITISKPYTRRFLHLSVWNTRTYYYVVENPGVRRYFQIYQISPWDHRQISHFILHSLFSPCCHTCAWVLLAMLLAAVQDSWSHACKHMFSTNSVCLYSLLLTSQSSALNGIWRLILCILVITCVVLCPPWTGLVTLPEGDASFYPGQSGIL